MSFSDVRSWLQSHDFTLLVVYQWLKGKEKIGISARLFNHHSFFSFHITIKKISNIDKSLLPFKNFRGFLKYTNERMNKGISVLL